ncbi:recombinase family protein [Planococcus plakortidis]
MHESKKYGYARVSSESQNIDVQIKHLKETGCEVIYHEKVSGRNTDNREQFNKLLNIVKTGDTIVVTKLDRFARSTRDALNTIAELEKQGVAIIVLNMGGEVIDTNNKIGKLMITILSGIAEFEADMIRERQLEGIAEAKARGVYKGRPYTYTDKHNGLQHAMKLFENRANNGYTVKQIADITRISKATIYRVVKEQRVKK